MSVTNWLRRHWVGVATVAFLASVGGLAGLTAFGGLWLVAAAVTGGATAVAAAVDVAGPFVAAWSALLVAALVSGTGVAWALGRRLWRVSVRGVDRLAAWAASVETAEYRAAASALGEHGDDQFRAATTALKRRYVAGDIGEGEFERAVEDLAAVDAATAPRADRDPVLDAERR